MCFSLFRYQGGWLNSSFWRSREFDQSVEIGVYIPLRSFFFCFSRDILKRSEEMSELVEQMVYRWTFERGIWLSGNLFEGFIE